MFSVLSSQFLIPCSQFLPHSTQNRSLAPVPTSQIPVLSSQLTLIPGSQILLGVPSQRVPVVSPGSCCFPMSLGASFATHAPSAPPGPLNPLISPHVSCALHVSLHVPGSLTCPWVLPGPRGFNVSPFLVSSGLPRPPTCSVTLTVLTCLPYPLCPLCLPTFHMSPMPSMSPVSPHMPLIP